MTELETWYQRDSGRYLLDSTRQLLRDCLDTSFGYHLAQVGVTRDQPLYQDSPIRHRVYVAATAGHSVGLVAEADELPLASDSVDTLIAHHSLEFTDNPHQVLREMHRVLTPQGHLIIVGFNPYSIQGMNIRARAMFGSALWRRQRSLSKSRLSDWLNVLGCEEVTSSYLYMIPLAGGVRTRALAQRCNNWCTASGLPMGGVYVVHAMKQVSNIIRPAQKVRRSARLIDLAVPKPVAAPRPTPRHAREQSRVERS